MVLQLPFKVAIYDCVIVGAGPAGIAASVHLTRSGYQVLLLEKDKLGGLLRNAQQVENYLGFLKIRGDKLVARMKAHVRKWAIPWKREEVREVVKEETLKVVKARIFKVHTSKNVYYAKTVLIASGTSPKKWELKVPKNLQNRIFYEWKGLARKLQYPPHAKVGILGGGDLAFDFALRLHEQNCRPLLFVRKKVSCLSLLLKRAQQAKLEIFEDTKIKRIKKQGQTLLLRSKKRNFEVDCILVAIGRVVSKPKTIPVKTQGLYFAGDVVNGIYRQAAIAAGSGLKAAMQICQELSSKNSHRPYDCRKRNR